MENTSASVTWSHRPEPDLIGVSVFQTQNQFSLRFHLRVAHLERLENPQSLSIRGSAQNGFILTPESDGGVKPFRVAKSDLFYVMQTVNKFDLSKKVRRTVWLRPEFENGHLRVPPLPPDWIAVEGEFMPGESANQERRTDMMVQNGKDHNLGAGNTSQPTSSPTVPPPKPAIPSFQLPTDTDLTRLQTELGQKLEECRAIIHQMEQRSGLRLMLDRNLRLVVNLTPSK